MATAVLYGWRLNLLKLVSADAQAPETIVRIVGLFMVPLGAIMGWFF